KRAATMLSAGLGQLDAATIRSTQILFQSRTFVRYPSGYIEQKRVRGENGWW
ncbi:unnamed protein product, partial [marine sediment metagenome]